MKFKQYKISKLNESVIKALGTEEQKAKYVATLNPTEAQAVNSEVERNNRTKEEFSEQEKNVEEFIKMNHDTEKKPLKDANLKKMKLSESLFEDAELEETDKISMDRTVYEKNEELEETDEDGWGDTIENALEDFFGLTEKVAYEIRHCRRGTYAVRGDKVEDLVSVLNNISDELTDAIDTISGQAEIINEAASEEKKIDGRQNRAPNEKKEKGNYSSEDLWLAVYDELSAEVDNEGEGKEVNKQLKAKRGERYEKVLPIGDSDIVVYATEPEKFEFAKKVANHYGVTFDEPKLDQNKSTNEYYKYSMRIHIPADDLYDWDNN